MLKSRALILSGSNGDDESRAPCWCQETERQTDHMLGQNLYVVFHFPTSSVHHVAFLHLSSSSWPSSSSFPHYSWRHVPSSLFLACFSSTLCNPTTTHHHYTHAHISTPLPLSRLTLINGDLQRWQHHYSCSVATPPRTEKNERKREDEGQDRRKMGSDGVEEKACSWKCLLQSNPQACTFQRAWCRGVYYCLWKSRTTVDNTDSVADWNSLVSYTNPIRPE